jgi:hypothetical protein
MAKAAKKTSKNDKKKIENKDQKEKDKARKKGNLDKFLPQSEQIEFDLET